MGKASKYIPNTHRDLPVLLARLAGMGEDILFSKFGVQHASVVFFHVGLFSIQYSDIAPGDESHMTQGILRPYQRRPSAVRFLRTAELE